VVAVSVNDPLWHHPIARASAATLRSWQVSVIEPRDEGSGLRLAPSDLILAEVGRRLAAWRGSA
jgi:hypothetical protein